MQEYCLSLIIALLENCLASTGRPSSLTQAELLCRVQGGLAPAASSSASLAVHLKAVVLIAVILHCSSRERTVPSAKRWCQHNAIGLFHPARERSLLYQSKVVYIMPIHWSLHPPMKQVHSYVSAWTSTTTDSTDQSCTKWALLAIRK